MSFVDAPAAMRIGRYQIDIVRTLPLQRGVYSQVEHSIDYGGELWVAEYRLTGLSLADGAAVQGWLDQISDPGVNGRLGTPLGASVAAFGTETATSLQIVGATLAGARAIPVDGATPAATLLAGTWLSIGNHLHRVRTDFTSDGTGAGSLSITPRLREAFADNQPVELSAPKSLWKVASSSPWVRDEVDRWEPVTLKLSEAIRP